MRKVLAFILLISHMNTSMFLPQVPEVDVYDSSGNQLDDINSIFEYVMVKIGLDHHADDEDDDSGQNLLAVTGFQFTPQPFLGHVVKQYAEINTNLFSEYHQQKIPSIAYDIIVPPPKS